MTIDSTQRHGHLLAYVGMEIPNPWDTALTLVITKRKLLA